MSDLWATEHKQAMPFAQNAAGQIVHMERIGHGMPLPAPTHVTTKAQLGLGRSQERENQRYGLDTWPHANPPAGYRMVPHVDINSLKVGALKMTPQEHQDRVAKKLETTDGLIVYHGLGSGKTFTAINAADHFKRPLLAIVPAALRNNMRKEVAAAGFEGEVRIVSYEEAHNLKDDPEFLEYARGSVVAYDEAHRMGRSESARSSLAKDIPGFKKLFLTGTPMRNHPSEMAPLLNAIGAKSIPGDKATFSQSFIKDEKTHVGFFPRLLGVKPGTVQKSTNMDQFNDSVAGKVDYNPSGADHFPTSNESVVDVPMSSRQIATYDAVMGKYPEMAYKVVHGIPPSKTEMARFQAFSTGPRMIANHPGEFNLSANDDDSPKMNAAVSEIKKRIASDPNYRGLSYSSYVGSGVNPMSRLLTKHGVSHSIFDGTKDDDERKQIVNDYNTGKIKHLLVTGAGSEGLDLKGTKLVQIMEPHWNEARITQMKGRAIRYKSHDHLPENERHVDVQRFHSVRRSNKFFGGTSDTPSIDGYIYDMSKKKDTLNQQFLGALQEPRKAAMFPSIDLTKLAWDMNPKLRAAADIGALGLLAEPTIHKWISGADAVSEREKDLAEVGGLGTLAAIEVPHLFGDHVHTPSQDHFPTEAIHRPSQPTGSFGASTALQLKSAEAEADNWATELAALRR